MAASIKQDLEVCNVLLEFIDILNKLPCFRRYDTQGQHFFSDVSNYPGWS